MGEDVPIQTTGRDHIGEASAVVIRRLLAPGVSAVAMHSLIKRSLRMGIVVRDYFVRGTSMKSISLRLPIDNGLSRKPINYC